MFSDQINAFTMVFLLALIAGSSIQCWLTKRHLRHVGRHRERVPDSFADSISLQKHRRAADYTRAKGRTSFIDLLVGAALLLAWTLGGGLALLDEAWRASAFPELARGVGFVLSAFIIFGALELPMSAYHTFGIEQRFGFNRTTVRLFVIDALKQGGLMLLFGAPLIAAVLWLMREAGPYWWLYVWLLWLSFSLALIWLYPVLIAPLFNRFTPLEDADLKDRIQSLLERNGLSSQGIFVMDGSRRSGHGNAYFTGFGANKRIVFFDTLLDGLNGEEIEAVLAHEIGHYKEGHITKQILFRAGVSLAGLAILGWLIERQWFFEGLGVDYPSLPIALLLFLLVVPVFSVFLQPIGAWLSRKHEFEADDFAAAQADPEILVRALVKLYRDNANTLTPDPWYSAFYDSHPPAPVRVAHLLNKASEART